jgi:hypothetical protein
MLYIDELENYIKHFPIIYAWKSEGSEINYSSKLVYYNVQPMLESARNTNALYEVHTNLRSFQYIVKGKIKTGFGVAIDIDTKDRENKVTDSNLAEGKKIAVTIAKELFSKYGLTSLLKFSGGGYHILMFFSPEILTDEIEQKDIKKLILSIIKQAEKEKIIDKTAVKEIEIKDDKIRAIFSYNSKYGNYSIPVEFNSSIKEDVEKSRTYVKQSIDYNELVNTSLENKNLSLLFRDIEVKKENSKKFLTLFLAVEKGIKELSIDSKTIKTDYNFENSKTFEKLADYIKANTKEKSNAEIKRAIELYINMEKSMSFYDKIYEYGVTDGRKRLLYLVIIPYLNIKTKGNAEEMERLAINWLKKSGVTENEIFGYMSEIRSSINNISPGVRPTSIDNLMIRFSCTKEEFLDEYLKRGQNE